MIIRALLEWDEEIQAYSATCPELNFVSSCGDTQDEAIANLQDAILLMLEPLPDDLLANKPSKIVELAI
jgi:predicted RNase H-like HicB family nuclease